MSVPEYHFKLILIGERGVGKSSIISRFTQNKPWRDPNPSAYISMNTIIHDKIVKIGIWDTGGQEIFGTIAPVYYRNAFGALLVFDVSSFASFQALDKWLKEIRERADEQIVLVMIGNQIDLKAERKVSFEEADFFAKCNSIVYLENSAVQGNAVQLAFEIMIERIFEIQCRRFRGRG